MAGKKSRVLREWLRQHPPNIRRASTHGSPQLSGKLAPKDFQLLLEEQGKANHHRRKPRPKESLWATQL